ncbi:hypothetical protein DM02DRAFT_663752 [Periconia macrospinosa]|uniref:DUF1772-domain-containing protein n=1 Tax=Periconia macrospinosa TaxID=97972 RepID=A0A2V1D0S9_9PLEO|nr:hypothetical protein DM02DRAFT_663752 [Periconia macrospinosa]
MTASVLIALRITPLVSSTSLRRLVANMYQMHAFHPWLQLIGHDSPSFGDDLSLWLPEMVKRSLTDLGISFIVGVSSGGLNLYVRTAGQAWGWYAASFAFTLAHLIFSQEALRQLEGAGNVEAGKQENAKALRKWLRMNKVRFFVSELPAFITAIMAVLLSLDAV